MRTGLFSIVLLLAAGLALFGWAEPLERRLVDAEFRFLRAHAPRAVANDVVIVGIDDESTQRLPEPLALWHPHIGKFLEAMGQAGAAVVGLDVVLPDRSFEDLAPGYDRALLTGMLIVRRTTPLVLALTVDPAGATRRIHPAFIVAAGPDASGYALLPVDNDGIVRRFDERLESGGNPVPTLAGQMARRLGKEVITGGLIDYAVGGAFRYIPLTDVLAWQAAGDTQKLEAAFRGKAVLLGGIFRFEDRLATPVALLDWDKETRNAPGVVVHAQVLRNLLNGGLDRTGARVARACAVPADGDDMVDSGPLRVRRRHAARGRGRDRGRIDVSPRSWHLSAAGGDSAHAGRGAPFARSCTKPHCSFASGAVCAARSAPT